jgi:hypothetical protein
MATTTKKKKPEAERIAVASSLTKLKDFNTPGVQQVLLEFIRHRDAGLRVSLDEWVDIQVRLKENDRSDSPSRLLAGYVKSHDMSDFDQTEALIAYIDELANTPDLAFGEALAAMYPDAEPEGSAADPTNDGDPQDLSAAEHDELTERLAREEMKEEAAGDAKSQARRRRPAAARPAAEVAMLNRRVVYKTAEGRVIFGICTVDGEKVTIVDDAGDEWTNVRRDAVRLDDGPVTWTITKAQLGQVEQMTKPGRGLWPDRDEHDPLFELARRVSPDKLVVVAVHNAWPEPFVDAYVFDESAGDGDNSVPFEHEPVESILSEYQFEVPGVGRVPARIVVVK